MLYTFVFLNVAVNEVIVVFNARNLPPYFLLSFHFILFFSSFSSESGFENDTAIIKFLISSLVLFISFIKPSTHSVRLVVKSFKCLKSLKLCLIASIYKTDANELTISKS